ncbi:MAG: hypothetical protein BWY59_01424 [Verrucomicrobia bacterium ADurb.Bin345]|nr:MAG: hypothetical protein BWY59_01424 [Verrucomicrobia bacterium ADurb.Bin345]
MLVEAECGDFAADFDEHVGHAAREHDPRDFVRAESLGHRAQIELQAGNVLLQFGVVRDAQMPAAGDGQQRGDFLVRGLTLRPSVGSEAPAVDEQSECRVERAVRTAAQFNGEPGDPREGFGDFEGPGGGAAVESRELAVGPVVGHLPVHLVEAVLDVRLQGFELAGGERRAGEPDRVQGAHRLPGPCRVSRARPVAPREMNEQREQDGKNPEHLPWMNSPRLDDLHGGHRVRTRRTRSFLSPRRGRRASCSRRRSWGAGRRDRTRSRRDPDGSSSTVRRPRCG